VHGGRLSLHLWPHPREEQCSSLNLGHMQGGFSNYWLNLELEDPEETLKRPVTKT